MSLALAAFKVGCTVSATAVVVGGGGTVAYLTYKNTKRSGQQANNADATTVVKNISTNLFIARAKETSTTTGTISNPMKCKIDSTTVDCNVYKFKTPKTTNNIESFVKTDVEQITTATSDLTKDAYFVVELLNKKLTFEGLKNKTIELQKKDDSTKVVDLEFDQLLQAADISSLTDGSKLEVMPKQPKTFLVETKTAPTNTATGTEPAKYRCKYTLAGKLDNVDDSCKLIAIPAPIVDDTITTLKQVKDADTLVTIDGFKAATVNTFFKLELDQTKLYNLDFESNASTSPELTIDILSNADAASVVGQGTFTLKQKLEGESFVGKTNLVLAQVTVTKTDLNQALTDAKCNFNQTVVAAEQFDCDLHSTTPKAEDTTNLPKMTIADTKLTTATTEAFAVSKYFLIKLGVAKPTTELTKDKKIYYQIPKTGASQTAHEIVELKIIQLLSGEIGTGKKPIFITNY